MEQPVDPSTITKTFVPTTRPDLVQVEVDGEIVLYDDSAKIMHRLSPIAGQVWRCLDGSGSLAEVAADLADVYQADAKQILVDVVATARQFGSAGLLVDVAVPSEGDDDSDPCVAVVLEETDSPFRP